MVIGELAKQAVGVVVTLHLMTQRNQPYGSERRCCEHCGIMIWTHPRPKVTDDLDIWRNPPEGFVRCVDLVSATACDT